MWVSDDTERKSLNAHEWRDLNMRRRYDRALSKALMQLERESSLCGLFKGCRVTAYGQKGRSMIIAVEIKHDKRCLAHRLKGAHL